MKRIKLSVPPGFPVETEQKLFYTALVLAELWSLGFVFRFGTAQRGCYLWRGENRYLRPDAVMPPFFQIVGSAAAGFGVAALCMAALILWHLHYYYEGSRSIYLMRRLPRRSTLPASILVSPLCRAAIILLAGIATLLIYALIYQLFTPPLCVPLRPWAIGMGG